MFNIIPLIAILVSLGVIIFIVVRKFSVLANLDVDSMPSEREAKVKEQIISNRLKRNFSRLYRQAGKVAIPLAKGVAGASKDIYGKLREYREKRQQEEELMQNDEGSIIDRKFAEIEDSIKVYNWPEAEKKCIEVIGLDPANVQAFQLLGRVYEEKKEYSEAIQTLEHALRLLEKNSADSDVSGDHKMRVAQIYRDLSDISRQSEKNEQALKYIESALEIEPNNPKSLDIKLQISIIIKDKAKALEALEKMKEVNVENQKLPEYEAQIKEL